MPGALALSGSWAGPMLLPPFLMTAGFLGVLALGLTSRRGEAAAAFGRVLARLVVLAGLVLLARRWAGQAGELTRWDGRAHAWDVLFFAGALPLLALMDSDTEIPAALAMAAVLGMTVIACANHLFMLFLGLELMSLSTYLLIVSLRRDRRTLEATIKYFFSGALAAALFLFGLSIFYAKTGGMAIALTPTSPAAQAGLLLMACAALFKIGAFPMQFWLPDVYDAAPPELAGFMSTAVKAAGFLLLLRIASLLPAGGGPGLEAWLPWIAVATMTFGNLLALRQERLQRLLAYSSLSHVGYLLAGVWAWLKLGALPQETSTIYLYLVAYFFMNTGAFLFIKLSGASTVSELRGYAARDPGLAGFFALMLFSLAAIPPTGGFLAKFYVIWDVLRANGAPLAVAVALNSVVGVAYYFRLIRAMILEAAPEGAAASPAAGGGDARPPAPGAYSAPGTAGGEYTLPAALTAPPASNGLGARAIAWACVVGTLVLGSLPWLRSLLSAWLAS